MSETKIVTLGCRINSYESEIFKEKLENLGFDNVIIINTCAVTGEAERQCRQTIRKLRKENPDARIIVTGCAAQIAPQKFASMEEVDLVIGNKEKTELEKYINDNLEEKTIVGDIMSYDDVDKYVIKGFEGRARAFVQVQQGCNHRCTYCIIPYARGNNRPAPMEVIIKQVKELVKSGFNEICLTGVDVCSYEPSFGILVKNILKEVPELKRLQLASLDPAAIDDDLFDLLVNEPRMLPHYHLSCQSGDDMILRRMKRRHLRADVIDVCNRIRKARPEVSFGADFITGFPTETEEMAENTIKLLADAGITHLHVFPYSVRTGTPAAHMPQVDVPLRKERAKKLRDAGEKAYIKLLDSKIGTVANILLEKPNFGQSDNCLNVTIDKDLKVGDIVKAKIIKREGNELIGEII